MSVHGLVEIDSHREPAQDHRPRDVDYIREGRRSNTLGGRGLRIAVRRRGGYITGPAPRDRSSISRGGADIRRRSSRRYGKPGAAHEHEQRIPRHDTTR